MSFPQPESYKWKGMGKVQDIKRVQPFQIFKIYVPTLQYKSKRFKTYPKTQSIFVIFYL